MHWNKSESNQPLNTAEGKRFADGNRRVAIMRVHCHTRCARVDVHRWMLQTGTTAILGRETARHRWPESFQGSFVSRLPYGHRIWYIWSCEDDGFPTGTQYSLVGGLEHVLWISIYLIIQLTFTPTFFRGVDTNHRPEYHGPVEIVDFPIKNGGSFHSYVNIYQRVYLIWMGWGI